jgi:hypothetical protein
MTRFHNHGHVESQTGDLSLKITDCCLDSVIFNQQHVAYYNEGTIVAGGGRLEVVVTGAAKENGLKKILTAIVEKGILEAQHIHLEAFIVLQEGQLRTRERRVQGVRMRQENKTRWIAFCDICSNFTL